MDKAVILGALADTHNLLVQISVRGDDAIRMAGALQQFRALINRLQKEDDLKKEDDNGGQVDR